VHVLYHKLEQTLFHKIPLWLWHEFHFIEQRKHSHRCHPLILHYSGFSRMSEWNSLFWCRLSGFAQINIQLCLAGWGWSLVFLNISYCHSETYRHAQLCRISLSCWEQQLSQHARSSTGKIKKCNNHSFFTTVPTPLPRKLMVNISLTARVQGLTQSQPQYIRLWPLRGSDAGLV